MKMKLIQIQVNQEYDNGGINMRKIFICFIIVLMFFVFTGCGSEKPKQTEQDIKNTTTETSKPAESQNAAINESPKPVQTMPSDQKPELSISAGNEKSAKLPKDYPSDKFPLYEGSYISGVMELDGGYTLTAFSKDEVKKVIAFYTKVLEGAKVTMDTKTDESLTSFGTKDGYTYNMDMGKSNEMEGYQTSIAIILQPIK